MFKSIELTRSTAFLFRIIIGDWRVIVGDWCGESVCLFLLAGGGPRLAGPGDGLKLGLAGNLLGVVGVRFV